MGLTCQQRGHLESSGISTWFNLGAKPFTRCGLPSMISKIYDPLGRAVPFLLKGKIILQDLCQNDYSWDDIVPSNFIKDWKSWKSQLHLSENVIMKRCFKPPHFGKIACCSFFRCNPR